MEVRIPHGQPLDITAAPTAFPPGSCLGLHVSLGMTVDDVAKAIEEMTRIPAIHWEIRVKSKDSWRTIKTADSAGDNATALAAIHVTSDDELVAGYGNAMVGCSACGLWQTFVESALRHHNPLACSSFVLTQVWVRMPVVKSGGGERISFRVGPFTRMRKLVDAVAKRLSISSGELALLLDGRRVLDGMTLFDLGGSSGEEFDALFLQAGC